MEKRYQVFVSSTYQDLQEERQEIMQALLELDCIPSGMELFPAANDDQWTLIKKVIDDCDYYILVVANRYGSIGPDGISYTEMEYRYALEKGKPIIGFLHKMPNSVSVEHSERTAEGAAKLEAFRDLIKKKTVKWWESPKELGSVVSRSIVQLIKSSPAVGWVRADAATNELSAPEILRLRTIIDDLTKKLEEVRQEAPASAADLAQGDDPFHFRVDLTTRSVTSYKKLSYEWETFMTWNEIFNTVGPYLMDEVSEKTMKTHIDSYIFDKAYSLKSVQKLLEPRDDTGEKKELYSTTMSPDDFQTVKIQLISLGFVEKSKKARGVRDANTYWTLTPYGEATLNKLRAVRKPV